jgi:hypothetical protein
MISNIIFAVTPCEHALSTRRHSPFRVSLSLSPIVQLCMVIRRSESIKLLGVVSKRNKM